MINLRQISFDCWVIFVTATIAVTSGYILAQIKTPAPYLMGSLFGTWLCGGLIKNLRPYLGMPNWFRFPVVLGLGVLIGASFTPEVIDNIPKWSFTLTAMIIATIIATACGVTYLYKYRKYDPALAFLCSVPGGQAEIVLMARQYVEKDYVVALFHLIRVCLVFTLTPFIIGLVSGSVAIEKSIIQQHNAPKLIDQSPEVIITFILTALFGYLLARLLRIPSALLLGPLILSLILHSNGWIAIPRFSEFVILAQVVIGGGIGARLSKVKFLELLSYLIDACVNTSMIMFIYIAMAYGISLWLDVSFIKPMLAFVPGGLYEVTLLALLFGYDIAFVAFHHTIRIAMILFSLSIFTKKYQKIQSNKTKDHP